MNQANNRIAKNTALLFAKSGIVLVVSLYASRVLLKKLGIEDYGVYHVVGSVVLMFMRSGFSRCSVRAFWCSC